VEILSSEKNISLQRELLTEVEIKGDPKSLHRVFFNILTNAIRYTKPDGTIKVRLKKRESLAIVSISDTGIGISKESLPHIFKRFYRVDKVRSREDGGSGLGLSICKQIIDIHKGTIEVESISGEGSTFTILLPIVL
jgi:signal transduction histidine kinase